MIEINTLVRENIKALTPYSSARDEYSGEGKVWLDANENPFETSLNRYPDPNQQALKVRLAKLKNLSTSQVFIGNGSDEAIDLLFRAFCEPKKDKAYVFSPTYGMYNVSAAINQIELVDLKLEDGFQLPSVLEIKRNTTSSGLLFICSPNNPTGNTYSLNEVKCIADQFKGIVVVDEAYIDFSDSKSAIELIKNTPNLVVLQTFSKAFGLAGLRLGMAFANSEIIQILNTIKPPYNISTYSQLKGIEALDNLEKVSDQIQVIKNERERLKHRLQNCTEVVKVYPSQANFLLVEFVNASKTYIQLKNKGIILRNRTSEIKNCLRISIGTKDQNNQLINALKTIV